MSFAQDVKTEIASIPLEKEDEANIIASFSGFIRNNIKISNNRYTLCTENMTISIWIYKIFKRLFNREVKIVTEKNQAFNKNNVYIIKLDDLKEELETLEVIDKKGKRLYQVDSYLVDDSSLMVSYLKGAFMASGSLNDPKTSRYHLEFVVSFKGEAIFIQRLLNNFDLNSRMLFRGKKYMIYIKEAEKISDLIKMMQANKSVLYFENVRVYREQKNLVNRLNNVEQSNLEKAMLSGKKQVDNIKFLKEIGEFSKFSHKEQEMAEFRLKYPESSLSELSEIIYKEKDRKITKSGLNHFFRKVKTIVENKKINKSK